MIQEAKSSCLMSHPFVWKAWLSSLRNGDWRDWSGDGHQKWHMRWWCRGLGPRTPTCSYHITPLITEVTHRVSTWVVSRSATAPSRCVFLLCPHWDVPFPPCCRRVRVVSHHCRLPNPVVAPIIPPFNDEEAVSTATGPFPLNFFANYIVSWYIM
jgi:hypothetical protein